MFRCSHTPSSRCEKTSLLLLDVSGCVAWSQVAQLTRCPRHRLVQPSHGRRRSIVCICGWPSPKALERTRSLSWASEDCVQRWYCRYSKCSGFFERVMTTHVAFNRSCSFLRILPSHKLRARSFRICVSVSRFSSSSLKIDFPTHNLEISLDRWLFPSHRFAD